MCRNLPQDDLLLAPGKPKKIRRSNAAQDRYQAAMGGSLLGVV